LISQNIKLIKKLLKLSPTASTPTRKITPAPSNHPFLLSWNVNYKKASKSRKTSNLQTPKTSLKPIKTSLRNASFSSMAFLISMRIFQLQQHPITWSILHFLWFKLSWNLRNVSSIKVIFTWTSSKMFLKWPLILMRMQTWQDLQILMSIIMIGCSNI